MRALLFIHIWLLVQNNFLHQIILVCHGDWKSTFGWTIMTMNFLWTAVFCKFTQTFAGSIILLFAEELARVHSDSTNAMHRGHPREL
jgi:hypothetical protein